MVVVVGDEMGASATDDRRTGGCGSLTALAGDGNTAASARTCSNGSIVGKAKAVQTYKKKCRHLWCAHGVRCWGK